jgi:hypothetical protein
MTKEDNSVRRSLLWTILGVVATVALGAPALYFTLKERTPALTLELTSEANVFDLHKSLDNLDIIFKGENIRLSGENLRILTLTIRNDGPTTILQSLYDETEPWGIAVTQARLVATPRVVGSNSDYLREKIRPTVANTNSIQFQKVIIEPGKYVAIEMLLLHKADQAPILTPFGKIAGINALVVSKRSPEPAATTFVEHVFVGSIWVNLSRFGIYTLLVILLFAVFIAFAEIKSLPKSRRITNEWRDRQARMDKHFAELFDQMTPIEKKLALALINSTWGQQKPLSELKSILLSKDTASRISETNRFIAELAKSNIACMFEVKKLLPKELFTPHDDGSVTVDDRAVRVVEALVDFISAHPVTDGIFLYDFGYKRDHPSFAEWHKARERLDWGMVDSSLVRFDKGI